LGIAQRLAIRGVNKALCPPTERTLLSVEAILLP
jgi:hypothetical protein